MSAAAAQDFDAERARLVTEVDATYAATRRETLLRKNVRVKWFVNMLISEQSQIRYGIESTFTKNA